MKLRDGPLVRSRMATILIVPRQDENIQLVQSLRTVLVLIL